MEEISKAAAFMTTKELAKFLSKSTRTIRNRVKEGRIKPHVEWLGGTYLRFIFPYAEVIRFLNTLPEYGALRDVRLLSMLDKRKGYAKKASAAARMARGKASGKG